jgi:hypothetical protein
VPTASDAFIPEWSQKSPGAVDNLRAEKANHLMQANHPSVTSVFNQIFNRPEAAFKVEAKK